MVFYKLLDLIFFFNFELFFLFFTLFIPQSACIAIQFTIRILSLLSCARFRSFIRRSADIDWRSLWVYVDVCMSVYLCLCVCHSLFVRYAFNVFISFLFFLPLLWFTFICLSRLFVCLSLAFSSLFFHFSFFAWKRTHNMIRFFSLFNVYNDWFF